MSTTNAKRPSAFARIYSLLRTGPRALFYRFYGQYARILTGAPIERLSAVTPQLHVGGQHRPRGWNRMVERGITAVVNMREEWHDDVAQGIGGERHLHLITIDNTPPALDDLQRGVDFIAAEIERGGKVYIHCGVGVGRAPIMAAAYLVSTGLTPEDALAKIRAVRPFGHRTSGQIEQLEKFAAGAKTRS